MSPTPVLNATCVALATANSTLFDPAIANLTACSFKPQLEEYISVEFVFALVFLIITMNVLCGAASCMLTMESIARNLRNIPADKLHREIEERGMRGKHGKEARQFWDDLENGTGRYRSVTCTTDVAARLRTVVVVEDMLKVPRGEAEWRRRIGERERERERKKQAKKPRHVGKTQKEPREPRPRSAAADTASARTWPLRPEPVPSVSGVGNAACWGNGCGAPETAGLEETVSPPPAYMKLI